MKEFYCRAEIKTERIWSEGFIHISKNGLIEGLFALDYVRIELDGKEMSLILIEFNIETLPGGTFVTKEKQTIYTSKLNSLTLESPHIYTMLDDSGSMLILKLKEPIKDPRTISSINEDIENYKS